MITITKIYKILRNFFVGEPRYEIMSNVIQCEGLAESFSELLIAKRYEKRFLVTIFESEDEDEDEIDELMDGFYVHFLECSVKRLSKGKERRRLLQEFSYEPEWFFDLFIAEGKETFFRFKMMIEEEGFDKEQEIEEFFKYFLNVDLRFFFNYEMIETTFQSIKISNFLVRKIVSEVICRQKINWF